MRVRPEFSYVFAAGALFWFLGILDAVFSPDRADGIFFGVFSLVMMALFGWVAWLIRSRPGD